MNQEGIGHRIKKVVDYSGLSDVKFARRIDVSQPMIGRYINGESEPGYKTLVNILEAFPEINRDWFVFGNGEPFGKNNDSPNIYVEIENLRKKVGDLEYRLTTKGITALQQQVDELLEWRKEVSRQRLEAAAEDMQEVVRKRDETQFNIPATPKKEEAKKKKH